MSMVFQFAYGKESLKFTIIITNQFIIINGIINFTNQLNYFNSLGLG
jgi:hypothetical protein